MNKASRQINRLLDRYCSPSAVTHLTGNGFLANQMQNFGGDFNTYLYNHYQVWICSYSTVMDILKKPINNSYDPDNLCIISRNDHSYRFVKERDIGTIQSLIRKWYQCSNEINLRLVLLFDSKLGSKFIAKKTNVPQKIISRARHKHIAINNLTVEDRLNLENLYMNSHIAQRIRNVHISFN